jgi:hypothetical protein
MKFTLKRKTWILSALLIGMFCLYIIILWRMHLQVIPAVVVENGYYKNSKQDYSLPRSIPRNEVKSPPSLSNKSSKKATTTTTTTTTVSVAEALKIRKGNTTSTIELTLPKALQVDPAWIDAMGDIKIREVGKDIQTQQCCSHWGQRKPREKKSGGNSRICTGICFTPQACDDMAYPFRSIEERKEYWIQKNVRKNFASYTPNRTADECMKPKRLVPPINWNTTSEFPFLDDLPPPGCSHYTGSGGSGPYQNLIIIPSAKLVFCGIPKVGITNWLQFVRFVMGAHDYASFPHGKPDLRYWNFDILNPDMQQRIWNDPSWKFATILRNPADRLLSAYLDKLKVGRGSGGIAKQLNFTQSFTFEVFLQYLEKEPPEDLDCQDKDLPALLTGLSWCSDPHWRPQVFGCGLSEKIDRFDFIGSLDHIEKHSQALLEKVGLWESHGQHYRHGISERTTKLNPCARLFPLSDEFEKTPLSLRHVGFQQRSERNDADADADADADVNVNVNVTNKINRNKGGNKTTLSWDAIGHARSARDKKEEYYTPELLRKVEDKLYRADFQVWNLLQKKKGDWASGKELLPSLLKVQENTNIDSIVAS